VKGGVFSEKAFFTQSLIEHRCYDDRQHQQIQKTISHSRSWPVNTFQAAIDVAAAVWAVSLADEQHESQTGHRPMATFL